eukprot:CAMPEP_0117449756 /NCGR_PEP_ID=MMETSP0759-20121206/8108_1 /TAXON_ID=63605 /ORGANISM="Percolomonas cosmopolitus, Strain WS" /LENGTH=110 /DNA_ID=CAMNT_0005242239 /DNA_START=152 /DNA_END=481 /DNA_ORIENTATION=+
MAFGFAPAAQKKKKWTAQGRTGEKLSNKVVFDAKTWNSFVKGAPKMKVITVAKLSEQFGITGSLAKQAIRELADKGVARPVVHTSNMLIYVPVAPVEVEEKKGGAGKKGK